MAAKKDKTKDAELSESEKLSYREQMKKILAADGKKPENINIKEFEQYIINASAKDLDTTITRFRKERDFYKGCLEKGPIHKAGPNSKSYQNTLARLENLNARGKMVFSEIQNRIKQSSIDNQ